MPPVWWGRPLAEMRWQAEFLRLLADPMYLGGGRPRGDGRPVVLVPGFAGGDWTLSHLAFWLRRTGYRPRTWETGHSPDLACCRARRRERYCLCHR